MPSATTEKGKDEETAVIDISLPQSRGLKKGQLVVRLEGPRPNPDLAKIAVESLLTARYTPRQCGWLIGADDLPYLDRALTKLGVEEDAGIEHDALTLADDRQAMIEAYTQKKEAPIDISFLDGVSGWKTVPFKDQLQCIRFHIERGRSIEGGETGIGKSLILLYTYLYWRAHGVSKRALILCNNSGKLDWEEQTKQHTTLTSFPIGNGTKEVLGDLARFAHGSADVLIMHYEALVANEKVFDALSALDFGYVAVDEVHTLKNPKSVRYKRVTSMLDKWKDAKMVCATGTACDGNPKSAWAPLRLTEEPGMYFPTYNEFERHFITYKERFFYGRRVLAEDGVKNLGRLKAILEPSCIRFLKAEVMGRKSKEFKTLIVTMTGGQRKLYDEVKTATIEQIKSEGSTVPLEMLETRLLRLRQILNHPKLLPNVMHFSGDSAKHRELDDVIEEVLSNPEAQVLVWTQWRAAVDLLVQRYREHGAIAYYGGSDDRAVRDAVLSKRARVIVAIPEKAGTSIDWLKVCRTAVYLEKPWQLTLYRQSVDRIDRRANTDTATIITIEAADSVDQIVNHVLKRRQDVFDALTIDDERLVAMRKEELLDYLK